MNGREIDILLVDDRDEDLLALKNILEYPGYRLVTARSGAEALRHILKLDFAVILVDVRMPVMDGFEVASIIKQRDRSRHTPIIFLTAAETEIGAIYKAYSVGAVDYLNKPIDPDVVRAKVAIFVDLFRKDVRIREQALALIEADRKEREQRIAELRRVSEKRYKDLADAIPQIVWTADAEGGVNYVNRRWQEYTGLGPEKALGWSWLDALHPVDAVLFAQRWRETLATKAVYEGECRLLKGSGGYRWHLCRAVPERGDDGTIIGWLGTYTDFNDMKEAVQMREEFLVIASHELRTPLSTLQISLQSAEKFCSRASTTAIDPTLMQDRLSRSLRQVDRLKKLVDSLLDVSRLITGRLQLHVEAMDLAKITHQAADAVADDATRAGSSLTVHANPGVIGRWDPMRIEQIVTNLMTNAIKYGAGKPIVVTVTRDATAAHLVIRDEGIGISAEHLPRIFDCFERAPSGRHQAGLGVGLYIVKQIVDAHGGSISVNSQPENGSTFTVDLPLEASTESVAALA